LIHNILPVFSWEHAGDSTLILYGAAPLLVAVLVLILLHARLPSLRRAEHELSRRRVVLAIGVISALTFAYEWGTLRKLPLVHDEAAYLLQARLFAAGKWSDSTPIPEFFEQPHVLVTPRYAAKYPPGNSLVLAPGIWLDRPGLMPVIILGISGALIFALGRRVVNAWVGVIAWMVWIGFVPLSVAFRPSYFAEVLTETLWLVAWWALLQWREDRGVGHLLLVAACIGWMAITRPLTAVAFAIPVGVVVVMLTWRRGAWAQLAMAFGVGVAILAILPLWSARTTGDWRVTPLMLYTDQYMPYDVPGFGLRERPALREPSPEIACFADMYGNAHRWHVPSAIPASFFASSRAAIDAFFTYRTRGLLLFALVGVLASPVELGLMLATCTLLLLAYTTYAHSAGWTVYYLETQPVCALLAAAGVWVVVAAIGRRWGRVPSDDETRTPGPHLAGWCFLVLAVLWMWPTLDGVNRIRRGKSYGDLPHYEFRQAVDSLPGTRKIVFVRYAPGEGCQQNLIENDPPLATAQTWIVNDRGADDVRLLRAAPDRVPYLFDAKQRTMQPLPVATARDPR